MNPYERPVAERLLSEAARIPLPPRERWTPTERHGSRLLPALAAMLAVIALAIVVAAPLLQQVPPKDEGVGAAGSSALPRAASLACAAQEATSAACRLITGRVVEVLGPQLVRITPDALTIAADFENPALFEADFRTRIEPAASSIGAAGVKPGATVQVAFDALAPKTASGAYTLTRFIVVSPAGAPDCSNGSPLADITRFPQGTTHGGATPTDAFRTEYPTVGAFDLFPYASFVGAPVWIVAGTDTYIATILPDGTWFVSPAKFVRCVSFEEIRSFPHAAGSSGSSSSPGSGATAPPRSPPLTVAEVTPQQVEVGMPAGAAIFARTDPTCVLSPDAASYRCALSRAPAPEVANFLEVKEPLVIGGRVAGGCLGLDRDGMSWECYIGQDAVDRAIIGQDLLGQPAPYPGRG